MAVLQSQEYTFTHLAANATTVIFTPVSGVGSSYAVIHSIVINTKGASANTLSLYNDVSAVAGNLIAALDTVNGQISTILYDVRCNLGITVVIATGTAADITVVWRKNSQE